MTAPCTEKTEVEEPAESTHDNAKRESLNPAACYAKAWVKRLVQRKAFRLRQVFGLRGSMCLRLRLPIPCGTVPCDLTGSNPIKPRAVFVPHYRCASVPDSHRVPSSVNTTSCVHTVDEAQHNVDGREAQENFYWPEFWLRRWRIQDVVGRRNGCSTRLLTEPAS